MTEKEILTLQSIDINTVDINTLVDLKDVRVDKTLPYEQRALEYVRQIKNPYCFKYDGAVVRLRFPETGPTFGEILCNLLKVDPKCLD